MDAPNALAEVSKVGAQKDPEPIDIIGFLGLFLCSAA